MFLGSSKRILAGCACVALLSSCTRTDALDPATVQSVLEKDLKEIHQQTETKYSLSLEEALARGLKYNLDARVAEMEALVAAGELDVERMNMLPTLNAKVQVIGRSNPGASRSLSILTGTQSVEPSISTEQERTVNALEMSWNALDLGLNIARARSAKDREIISLERRRKVLHNLVQDIYASYWQTAAAHKVMPSITDLIEKTNLEIEKIDKSVKADLVPLGDAKRMKGSLMEKRRQLTDIKNQLMFSELSLKTLLAMPSTTRIELSSAAKEWVSGAALPANNKSVEAMERAAFMNRPEVHEEFLNRQISMRDVRMTILETLPGAEIVLGFNKDKNQFLEDEEWLSGTTSITQSITKILTLPARHKRAENNKLLADKRRQALIAAVMTQVRVADMRYEYMRSFFENAKEYEENAQVLAKRARGFEKTGMINKTELIDAEITAAIGEANKLLAYAQAQETYCQLMNTLGVDIWSNTSGMDIPDLTDSIRKNLDAFAAATLDEMPVTQDGTKEVGKG